MTVSLIAAVASNGVIGRGGSLPWKLADDLARFKRLTMGHPLIMGRATFRSMGRALPGRINIVLTRDAALRLPGCTVVHSVQEALGAASAAGTEETFVIGGGEIYAQFLPHAARLYLTWVDAVVDGDVTFPEVDWKRWRVVSQVEGTGGGLPHRFVDYARPPG